MWQNIWKALFHTKEKDCIEHHAMDLMLQKNSHIRMTGKRSVRSLPDAACLIGLTSQLDEAMEDMIMGTVGQFSGFVSLFKIKNLNYDWPRDYSVKALDA